jgi:Flp pilus assembly protein TadD
VLRLGLVPSEPGQHEKVAEMIREALQLAPGERAWHSILGTATLALQRFEEARKIIHEAQARKMDD